MLCAASAWPQAGDPGRCLVQHLELNRSQVIRPDDRYLEEFQRLAALRSQTYFFQSHDLKDTMFQRLTVEKTSEGLRGLAYNAVYSATEPQPIVGVKDYQVRDGRPTELLEAMNMGALGPSGTRMRSAFSYVAAGPGAGSLFLVLVDQIVEGAHLRSWRSAYSYRPDGVIDEQVSRVWDPALPMPDQDQGRTTWEMIPSGERRTEWAWDTTGTFIGWHPTRKWEFHFNSAGRLVSKRHASILDRAGKTSGHTREDYPYDAEGRLIESIVYLGVSETWEPSGILSRLRYRYDPAKGEVEESQVWQKDVVDSTWNPWGWWVYRFDGDCRLNGKEFHQASLVPRLRQREWYLREIGPLLVLPRAKGGIVRFREPLEQVDALGRRYAPRAEATVFRWPGRHPAP